MVNTLDKYMKEHGLGTTHTIIKVYILKCSALS